MEKGEIMATKKYLTTLMTRPFLYKETKEIATLMNEGNSIEEMKKMVLQENIFQLASKDRAERFYKEILKRLAELDEFLLNAFIHSDTPTSKAILFYALLKKDHLFYEWMREVVWDKLLIMELHVNKKETIIFFENKAEQDELIRHWKQVTKRRLINAYHQVLVDAEFAVGDGEALQLQPLIISPNIRNYLIEHKEKNIVEVLLGESLG